MNRTQYVLFAVVLSLSFLWAMSPVIGTSVYSDEKNAIEFAKQSSGSAFTNENTDSARGYDDEFQSESEDVSVEASQREVYMIAREYNGRLCLFSPEDTKNPREMLDVYVNTLPESDRDMFRAGVSLYSESEVTRLLEDYTS